MISRLWQSRVGVTSLAEKETDLLAKGSVSLADVEDVLEELQQSDKVASALHHSLTSVVI